VRRAALAARGYRMVFRTLAHICPRSIVFNGLGAKTRPCFHPSVGGVPARERRPRMPRLRIGAGSGPDADIAHVRHFDALATPLRRERRWRERIM